MANSILSYCDFFLLQSSALVMTAGQGHLNIVKFLMNSGAEVNAQDEV